MGDRRRTAFLLALAVPAALLGGALIAEHGFGLPPCEMCWWQRYPHIAAVLLAAAALVTGRDVLVRLAALAILASAAIGAFHTGVEYGWWEGLTRCASGDLGSDPLASIMAAPLVRCDVAPWSLAGVSLAGWNFLVSSAAGVAILALLGRRGRAPRRTAMSERPA
jgi:disulfide bond formation protein DsbB